MEASVDLHSSQSQTCANPEQSRNHAENTVFVFEASTMPSHGVLSEGNAQDGSGAISSTSAESKLAVSTMPFVVCCQRMSHKLSLGR